MRLLIWNIVLALLWAAMMEDFSPPSLFIGFAIGLAVLSLLRPVLQENKYFGDIWELFILIAFFFTELLRANLRMAYYTLMPLDRMRPGVIAVPLEPMSDTELTVLANLITLTPGTLSIDVHEDPTTGRRLLFVHVMHFTDADDVRRDIKRGFESRVLEGLR